jgi:hypothetical protein
MVTARFARIVLASPSPTKETLAVADDSPLIGAIGLLIVATRGSGGPGEVLIKIRGGSEAYIAWSSEPLPKGSTVLVINDRGTRTVDVSEWADPLNPFPAQAV